MHFFEEKTIRRLRILAIRLGQRRRQHVVVVATTCCLRLGSSLSITPYRCRGTRVLLHERHRFSQSSSRSSSGTSFDDLMAEVLDSHPISSNTGRDTGETTNGWRRLPLKEHDTAIHAHTDETSSPPSPVDMVMIRDRLVYIKRDDLVRLPGSHISGNKARKMLALEQIDDPAFFPSCVASYGGPQSNAMLALAAIVHYQNTRQLDADGSTSPNDDKRLLIRKRFVYYTKVLPRFLRNQPSGNLFRALALGMELVELAVDDYNSLFGNEWGGTGERAPLSLAPPVPNDSVWIPQGGACRIAVAGTRQLAREVYDYWSQKGAEQPLSLCIPGGTCTTALLVHHELRALQRDHASGGLDIQVVVIPCVGDESYARRQMMYLNAQVLGGGVFSANDIPTILRPVPNNSRDRNGDYFRFGEPDSAILNTFRELRNEHDVVMDLLYGAPAWTILLRHWTSSSTTRKQPVSFDPEAPLDGRRVMYIHSGGLEGINTQLLRYKHKNLVDKDEIQLPGQRSTRGGEKNEMESESSRPNGDILDILPFPEKVN